MLPDSKEINCVFQNKELTTENTEFDTGCAILKGRAKLPLSC
jgi:hypothetical protein